MTTTKRWGGWLCPTDPDHGPLLPVKDGNGWLCPHSDHRGRPKTHSAGKAPETRFVFTTEEAERAGAA